ncbi:hypothetical protein [Stappia sp.]|uniref:hypothetical protein n=1 Tax=Stappia sp. TaxID=1870903 RepID=UPI003A9A2685
MPYRRDMLATVSPDLALTCVAPAVVQPLTVRGAAPAVALDVMMERDSPALDTGDDVTGVVVTVPARGVGTAANVAGRVGVVGALAGMEPVAMREFAEVAGGRVDRSTLALACGPAAMSSKLGCDVPSMARWLSVFPVKIGSSKRSTPPLHAPASAASTSTMAVCESSRDEGRKVCMDMALLGLKTPEFVMSD